MKITMRDKFFTCAGSVYGILGGAAIGAFSAGMHYVNKDLDPALIPSGSQYEILHEAGVPVRAIVAGAMATVVHQGLDVSVVGGVLNKLVAECRAGYSRDGMSCEQLEAGLQRWEERNNLSSPQNPSPPQDMKPQASSGVRKKLSF